MILRVRPEGRVSWTFLCEPIVAPSLDELLHRTVCREYRDALNDHPLREGDVVLEFELIDDEGERTCGALEPGDYFDYEGDMMQGEQTQAANRDAFGIKVSSAEQSSAEAEQRLRELGVAISGITFPDREVVHAVDSHVDPSYTHKVSFPRTVGQTLEEFSAECTEAFDQLRRKVLDHRAAQQNPGGIAVAGAIGAAAGAAIDQQLIKAAVETVPSAPRTDREILEDFVRPDAADAVYPDLGEARLSYLPDGSAPVQPGDLSREGIVSREAYERVYHSVMLPEDEDDYDPGADLLPNARCGQVKVDPDDHRSDALPYVTEKDVEKFKIEGTIEQTFFDRELYHHYVARGGNPAAWTDQEWLDHI